MWHWSADTLFWQLSIDHNKVSLFTDQSLPEELNTMSNYTLIRVNSYNGYQWKKKKTIYKKQKF